jgi:hypothetical protein
MEGDKKKTAATTVVATLSITGLALWAYCALTGQRLKFVPKGGAKLYVITGGKAVRKV